MSEGVRMVLSEENVGRKGSEGTRKENVGRRVLLEEVLPEGICLGDLAVSGTRLL